MHNIHFFLLFFRDSGRKGSHDTVCLRRVTPIRRKWSSIHGFQKNENGNKFVEKIVEYHDKNEWVILSASYMKKFHRAILIKKH